MDGVSLGTISCLDTWMLPLRATLRQSLLDGRHPPVPLQVQFLESQQWARWSSNREALEQLAACLNAPVKTKEHTDHVSACDIGVLINIFSRRSYVRLSLAREAIYSWSELISNEIEKRK